MHIVETLSCQTWPFADNTDVWRKHFAPLIPTRSSERAAIVWLGKKRRYVTGRTAEDEARLFSVFPVTGKEATGMNLNTESSTQSISYCKVGQKLPQVTQRGCRVSIFGHVKNLSGQSPGQLALADPVQSGEIELGNLVQKRVASA